MAPIRISLPTGFEVERVNCYLFLEPEVVLVDTGVNSDESWAALEQALAQHGLEPSALDRVVITHPHVDHFGLASRLAAAGQAEFVIGEAGAPWLLDPAGTWRHRIDYYRQDFLPGTGLAPEYQELVLAYMAMTAKTSQPLPPARVRTFAAGDNLSLGGRSWHVLHLPGHAGAQYCFYQPGERWFLSADMLLQTTPTPVVEAPPAGAGRTPSLPQFLDSLARVEAMAIDLVYPGHGPPFTGHRALIQRQRQRIRWRQEEALGYVAAGQDTLAVLLESMYAGRPLAFQLPGLWMLVGYLDLLLAEGRVQESVVDGVWHYSATPAANGDARP